MEKENFHGYFTGLLSSLKAQWFPLCVACVGLILIGYGLITYLMPIASSEDIVFEARSEKSLKKTEGSTSTEGIFVDISGSVRNPGVYRLSENARVEEAILAAGGFSDVADLEWTQHSLNLAAKLHDGVKVYIPKMGEMPGGTETKSTAGIGTETVIAGASTNSLISINSASGSELESLPGVGPVTATKIMDHRPYGNIDELLSKKVVGNSVFEKIKGLVTL